MSPLAKKKLSSIRNKLDKLDNSLFNLVKKRFELVKAVLKLKNKKKQIIDYQRIKQILNRIQKKSYKYKVDPKITKRIWSNMIYAFIEYEKRNFKRK